MIGEKMDSQEILNRLMSAYGVSSQKGLAEELGIPANNISGWIQRDKVPGNPIIKCALDTGTDLRWLVSGGFANANNSVTGNRSSKGGKALIQKMLSTGGRAVLQRIMDAYGFKTQKDLSEYLDISTGTISTWVRRAYFPGDVVITCALDTGVSLQWLATGSGDRSSNVMVSQKESLSIPKKILSAGCLIESGYWYADLSFLSLPETELMFVVGGNISWVMDIQVKNSSNGMWLLSIDGNYDVYDVQILPGKKVSLLSKGHKIVCDMNEINFSGRVLITLNY